MQKKGRCRFPKQPPQLMDLLGAFSWRRRFAADDPNVAHLEKDDENRETCFFCWVVGMGLLYWYLTQNWNWLYHFICI